MTEPVMPSAAIDAAASTARAIVTNRYLRPGDPAYPLTEGGFWGCFMRSLKGRWESIKERGPQPVKKRNASLAAFEEAA